MSPDPKDWRFPVLGGVIAKQSNFHVEPVRELSEEEQEKIERFIKKAAHTRNRFKLFAILRRNYEQWWEFTRSLLTPGGDLVMDDMLELDRLLLNFQSAAKSAIDHFRQEWVQTYRGTPEEKRFQEFIERIEKTSWAFAFFQDLRNFTQHCGLPVGNYSRKTDAHSVILLVEADAEWLLKHHRNWNKSNLTKEKGRLDLIDLTREYFHYLHTDFGKFVSNAFAPDLIEIHNFFAALSNEVTSRFPEAEFKIVTKLEWSGNRCNLEFKSPPANLLGWIGISMAQDKPRTEQPQLSQQPSSGCVGLASEVM